MKSELNIGVCVSCGREPGRTYRVCPYCGEQVWQPLWQRAGRAVLLAAVPLTAVGLAFWARPDWGALVRLAQTAPIWSELLFAAGLGLLLLPYADDDRVVSSRAELVRWQALAVGGALLSGLVAFFAAVSLRFGREVGVAAWALAAVAFAGVACAPGFFLSPWRAVVASGMIVAAIALG